MGWSPAVVLTTAVLLLTACHRTTPGLPAAAGGAVAGVVRVAGGGPQAGVRVRVAGTGLTTRTDAAGRYALRRVPAGEHWLQFRAAGLVPLDVVLRVADGGRERIDLTLARAPRRGRTWRCRLTGRCS